MISAIIGPILFLVPLRVLRTTFTSLTHRIFLLANTLFTFLTFFNPRFQKSVEEMKNQFTTEGESVRTRLPGHTLSHKRSLLESSVKILAAQERTVLSKVTFSNNGTVHKG